MALDERIHQDAPRCSKISHLQFNEILSLPERLGEVIPLDARAVEVRIGIEPTLHAHFDAIDSDATGFYRCNMHDGPLGTERHADPLRVCQKGILLRAARLHPFGAYIPRRLRDEGEMRPHVLIHFRLQAKLKQIKTCSEGYRYKEQIPLVLFGCHPVWGTGNSSNAIDPERLPRRSAKGEICRERLREVEARAKLHGLPSSHLSKV